MNTPAPAPVNTSTRTSSRASSERDQLIEFADFGGHQRMPRRIRHRARDHAVRVADGEVPELAHDFSSFCLWHACGGGDDPQRVFAVGRTVFERRHVESAGQFDVGADQTNAVFRPQLMERADRFRRKAAVRHRDDQPPARREHARDVAEYFDRAHQILHRHRDQHGVERAVVERQPRIAIEVLHHPHVEPRIRVEFGGVHAETGDRRVARFFRQMRNPRRHQVEYAPAVRQHVAVVLRQRRDRAGIDVRDEPRHLIEVRVVALVDAREQFIGQTLIGAIDVSLRLAVSPWPSRALTSALLDGRTGGVTWPSTLGHHTGREAHYENNDETSRVSSGCCRRTRACSTRAAAVHGTIRRSSGRRSIARRAMARAAETRSGRPASRPDRHDNATRRA